MNKSIIISKEELKKLIHIQDDRTIESYIKDGVLPVHSKNNNGDCLFSRAEIYKVLGLERDPNEEFITSPEAAIMLGVDAKEVRAFAKRRNIPYYTIRNARGSNAYYLPSEIKVALEYIAEWGNEFPSFVARNHFLSLIYKNVLDDKIIKNLKENERQMLIGVILERKTMKEVSEEIGITPQQGGSIFHVACKRAFYALNTWMNKVSMYDSLFEENLKIRAANKVLLEKINTNQRIEPSELEITDRLGISLMSINFSSRARSALIILDAKSLGDLTNIQRSYLPKLRGVGVKTIKEIEAVLKEYGFWWKEEY